MTAHRIFTACTFAQGALLGSFVLGVLVLSSVQAQAQGSDMQILLDRMERMERDIRTLNRQIARGPGEGVEAAVDAAPATEPETVTPAAPKIEFNEGEGALARLTVRLSAMEEEVRQVTGLAEGMSFRIEQITTRLDKLITDLDYRLARLEGGTMGGGSLAAQPTISAAPSPPSVSKVGEMTAPTATMPEAGLAGERGGMGKNGTYVPPQSGGGTLGSISKSTLDQMMSKNEPATTAEAPGETPEPDGDQMAAAPQALTPQAAASAPMPAAQPEPSGVLPEGTPRERYQFAFSLMSQARYDDAETALKEFIAKHGDDQLVGNAWYWLGEAHYVRKSFMEAAQTFFQAYKIAPEGSKAADSLLKLGMSMANLDKTEEACTTFGKLRKEFVDLKPSIKRTLNRETKRLKCQ